MERMAAVYLERAVWRMAFVLYKQVQHVCFIIYFINITTGPTVFRINRDAGDYPSILAHICFVFRPVINVYFLIHQSSTLISYVTLVQFIC